MTYYSNSQHVLCGPFESQDPFVGSVSSKRLLCTVQTSFAAWTFALMVQRQWRAKLLACPRESRQWCQTVRLVTVFFIIMHVEFFKKLHFHSRMSVMKQQKWWMFLNLEMCVEMWGISEMVNGCLGEKHLWGCLSCKLLAFSSLPLWWNVFLDSWKNNLSIWQTSSQTWMQKLAI